MNRAGTDEVASKPSDASQRRTGPEDHSPYSPAEIEKFISKGKDFPHGRGHSAPDHIGHQKPQFEEDQHSPGYDNDVPLTGDRAFLRGGGEGHIYGSRNQNPAAKHGLAGQESARKRAEAAEAAEVASGGFKQPSGRFKGTGQDFGGTRPL